MNFFFKKIRPVFFVVLGLCLPSVVWAAPLLTAQSFTVNLPKTGTVSEKQNASKTVLNVTSGGLLIYQGESLDETQLKQILSRDSKNNEYRLQVAIDAAVSYDKVAGIMVLIQESGVRKVFFVTNKAK